MNRIASRRIALAVVSALLSSSTLLTARADSSASTQAQSSGTITQLFAFTCFGGSNNDKCPQGARPDMIIQASDGDFYGGAQVTDDGVSDPQGGTLFKLTPAGQFTKLFTFAANAQGQFLNGNNPVDGFLEANDGFIYGSTFNGGSQNQGVLFRISKSGTSFKVLHNFCSKANCTDGATPVGLVLGQDANIYGVTQGGGSNADGTIFRFEPATGSFTTIFTFNGSASEGSFPSPLTLAADGNFYGITAAADVNNSIFRFVPGTSQFTILFTFPGFQRAEGQLVQAANGDLFGIFDNELTGVFKFFSISPDGTEFQSFGSINDGDEVNFPLFLASDGNIWTTSFFSKGFSDGSAFNVTQDGAVLESFRFNGSNGMEPEVGVIQGADGKIYGTTELGGTISGTGEKFADGTVWSLDVGLPLPSPAIALLNPASGSVGSTVLINGNNFIGATAVSFNGVSATSKVLNLHFISVKVPVGATSGPITVSTPGGASVSTQTFTVN